MQNRIPVQEMESTPGPKYSTIAPVPPFTVKMPATLRITSDKEKQKHQMMPCLACVLHVHIKQ